MINKVKEIFSDVLNLEESIINDNFSQQTCERWDSLNHLNIVIALEEEFDVSFEPEEIATMTSLQSVLISIESKRSS